jgi:hypothetical protein
MPRRSARPQPDRTLDLSCQARACPCRAGPLRAADIAQRTVTALEGLVRLRLRVRNRRDPACPGRGARLRPEREGRFALPRHEFGLDVIAAVGRLRRAGHRSAPEIHAESVRRGPAICVRTVADLLGRYDELLALSCPGAGRPKGVTAKAGRVILAIDGLRPDAGHEALRVIRDVLSGEVLLARGLLPSSQDDPAGLPREVKAALDVPIAGVVSDGRASIREAAAEALKGVPHQPCHPHYLREAAMPTHEADRHAEVQLEKEVRGIRPIEREVEGRDGAEAETVRGDCAAVRPALTDGGRPPLEASGLRPSDRSVKVADGLDRVAAKRGRRKDRPGRGRSWRRGRRRPSPRGRGSGWPSAGSGGSPPSRPTRRCRARRRCDVALTA